MPQGEVTAAYDTQPACACALCAAASPVGEQTARATSAPVDGTVFDADQAVDGLLSGVKWATTSLTFSFPDSASDYAYRGYLNVRDTFAPATEGLASAARAGFAFFAEVSGLEFTELTGAADAEADLMIGRSAAPGTAFAYFPFSGDEGGDAWFNRTDFNDPVSGSYAWATVLHEIGHALGLKHGHETGGAGAVPYAFDSHEFTLMTYRSYVGSPGSAYTNGSASGPQTPMMLDIAAVQRLYGANFEHRSGDDVYAFTPGSGRMAVNGVLQEETRGNVVFRTIWDGGGEDLYDFSAFERGLAIDLAPGGFVDLDPDGTAQRAWLGGGVHARGHVFNALEFEGDARSLIEHATGGGGADLILGNRAGNRLEGLGGDDSLDGLAGSDTLAGGAGADLFRFDLGYSAFGDVDLILDLDFGEGDRIELLGLPEEVVAGSFFFGAGGGATISSLEDLRALSGAGGFTLAEAEAGAAALVLSAEALSQTIILGAIAFSDLFADPAEPAAADAADSDTTTVNAPMAELETPSPAAPEPEPPAELIPVDPLEEPVAEEPEPPAEPVPVDPLEDPLTQDPEPPVEPRLKDPEDEPRASDREPTQEDTADESRAEPEPVPPPPLPPAPNPVEPALVDSDLSVPVDIGRDAPPPVRIRGAASDETLTGGAGDEIIAGRGGDDRVRARGGDDTVKGQAGADTLNGGGGDDILKGGAASDRLFGAAGGDRLVGQRGDDALRGGGGDDAIRGGAGADSLWGQAGDDELTGGAGGDRFFFRPGAGDDIITDFTQGADRIVIAGPGAAFGALLIEEGAEGAVIRFADYSVTLAGMEAAALSAQDFLF
ncbi:MAG: M10 family metallopeptidase [Pikeienuella sp.]|uniref:M10 family metallopeptidase n=1 Tax=Pikeienuella sp. TaxID=2831957 RepID=UPI00391CE6F4